MYAPVAGEIVETNDAAVERRPERRLEGAGGDPYGKFWLVKLKVRRGQSWTT